MHAALVDVGGARSVLAQLLRRTARVSSKKLFTTEHLDNRRVSYSGNSQARSRCLKLGRASSLGRCCALPSPALAVMSAKRPKTIDAFFVRKSSAVGGAGARQKCADSASVVANAAKGGDGDGDSAQPEKQQQQQQQAKLPAALTGSPGTGAAVADGKIQANRNRALVRRAIAEAAAAGAEAGAGSGSAPPALSLSTLLVEPTWRDSLGAELQKPYIKKLESFLHGEWAPGRKPVFPPKECVFAAFNACPFDKVRVVILGQDPYHGPGQAMGLSFSVPAPHRPLPPSLLNMYKEARQDLGWTDTPKHGDLTSWSVQGVLLLNTCLTVRQGEANSHSKRGWEDLTDEAIRALSRRRSGVVFMLWGKPAEAKAKLIDGSRHHALVAAHPSPLSASRGFFGCRHFSRANALLEAQGLAPIDWWPAA